MNSYGSPCVIVASARALEEVRAVAELLEEARAGRATAARRFARPTSRNSLLIASHISPEICSRTERAFSRASVMQLDDRVRVAVVPEHPVAHVLRPCSSS